MKVSLKTSKLIMFFECMSVERAFYKEKLFSVSALALRSSVTNLPTFVLVLVVLSFVKQCCEPLTCIEIQHF